MLEGSGATTIVDGKHCPMAEGDLILTPGMSWHEHTHAGSAPIVWLDALDVPLHALSRHGVFEPGPLKDVLELPDDSAFAAPNIVPELPEDPAGYSPVFRYPRAASLSALKSAPLAKDGARKIRYVNPLNGGPAMSLLDCYMTRLDAGTETIPYRTTSNSVCVVVEGTGSSRVGNETFEWEPEGHLQHAARQLDQPSLRRRQAPSCSWSQTARCCAGSTFWSTNTATSAAKPRPASS